MLVRPMIANGKNNSPQFTKTIQRHPLDLIERKTQMSTSTSFNDGFRAGSDPPSLPDPFRALETIFPNPFISSAEAEEQEQAYQRGYEAGVAAKAAKGE